MASDHKNVPANRLTRDNIGEHAEALKILVTEDVFAQLTRGFKELSSAKTLPQYFERLARAHPFAVAWSELQESVEAASIQLSEAPFFLLDMRFSLMSAAADPEFPKLLNRLKGDDEFFSAAFEAFVFHMYAHEFKLPIAFVSPGNGKQPDLVSDFGDEGKVYLECKSLLDDVRLEERTWNRIREAVTRRLEAGKRSIEIAIVARRSIEPRDAAEIVSEAFRTIDDPENEIRVDGKDYVVSKRLLMDDGKVMQLPINFSADADYSMVFGYESREADATKIWMIKTKAFSKFNQVTRMRELFRAAKKQLPKDHPGIVHFQIPYRNTRQFQKSLDDCRDTLINDLNRRKHICAIVITGRFLDHYRENGSDPITTFHSVIPNYAAELKLPDAFLILGSHKMTTVGGNVVDPFELPPTGVICINFEITKDMSQQAGRYIIQYCSGDGRRQLNLWQDFFDRSRLEVWHEESGHHVLDFDMTGIEQGKLHKAAIRWNGTGLAIALNGMLLASSGADAVTS
ncbi:MULTISPECIES: hypothetical protein [unclassified Mesorhizobium]|uniref:hypothetical protein n=1 Tax=unclassified Mesorhizobium TaxID=325217 RepID=UPI0024168269|nr:MULTISPECIES: hypothetical protein [unclassified Mesorhizobium]MDG4900522.1 hypothetical protein [Mesorhizobium sp. WSM4962]MDG4917242.1 hypothetical protein [Mesorhizobium sp. WSM4989]